MKKFMNLFMTPGKFTKLPFVVHGLITHKNVHELVQDVTNLSSCLSWIIYENVYELVDGNLTVIHE